MRSIRFLLFRRHRSDQNQSANAVAPAPPLATTRTPATSNQAPPRPSHSMRPTQIPPSVKPTSKGPPNLKSIPGSISLADYFGGRDELACAAAENANLCAICLEQMDEYPACSLPCKHSFHSHCITSIRSRCTAKLCPLCRAELPPSASVLYDRAMNKYFDIERKQLRPWEPEVGPGHEFFDELSQAVEFLRGAADQGHAEAQANYGFMCSMGRGIPQDSAAAATWYKLAAEQGFAKAQLNLGVMFKLGKGVVQSDERAFEWFKKAAEQGYDNAQARLGYMYKVGCGVAASDVRAVHWYEKAALQGHSEAQCALGTMHRFGRGVPQNNDTATHWYLAAAKEGHAVAQRNLGFLYQLGQGVEKDDTQAKGWFQAAADQGDSSAIFWLGSLDNA